MTFKCYNLGCKVNLYEIEAISSLLIDAGFKQVDDLDPTVIVVNTCTVTTSSDQKSKKMLRQLRALHPHAIIVAMGCFIQFNQQTTIEGVDILIGANNKSQIINLIMDFLEHRRAISIVKNIDEYQTYDEMKLGYLTKHTRGFIKIQDGCENFCSYCAIPLARGKIKSRNVDDVLFEINELVNQGVKEIVLAGINLGTYGQDLKTITLASLIDKIVTTIPGLYRLRISSIELMEITNELLDVIKKHQNVIAQHLHIPLQGGTDSILTAMNRRYDTKTYQRMIEKIRLMFDGIAITTDFLAGFVGETEEEFKKAVTFLQQMQFADMHIFPYSRRHKTKADQMSGHLPASVIATRAKVLNAVAANMAYEYRKQFINKEIDVLFEQKKQGFWYGHTSNYLEVKVASDEQLENQVLMVKIIDVSEHICLGQVVLTNSLK